MRKVVASTFITLDGFMVGPNEEMDWNLDIFNEEMGNEITRQQNMTDTMLLGRKTYDIFVGYWAAKTDDDPIANHINNVSKIVFSKTLKEAPWGKWDNARIVNDNIKEEILDLKQQPGKDIAIIGSASIVQAFTNLSLIDEYRLMLHPVLLSGGKPLFKDIQDRQNLELVKSETFSNGVLLLHYQPKSK